MLALAMGAMEECFGRFKKVSAHATSLVVEDVALREMGFSPGFSTGIDVEAAPLGAKRRSPSAPWKNVLEGSGRYELT